MSVCLRPKTGERSISILEMNLARHLLQPRSFVSERKRGSPLSLHAASGRSVRHPVTRPEPPLPHSSPLPNPGFKQAKSCQHERSSGRPLVDIPEALPSPAVASDLETPRVPTLSPVDGPQN